MSGQSIVRKASPEDRAELWRLFRLHHAENGLSPLSEGKVQYILDRALEPEKLPVNDYGPRGIVGVIGSVGNLEGVIMLVLGSLWYSEAINMDDCVNFIDPAHRQSFHAKALLGYAKNMVDEIRVKYPDFYMMTGIVSTKRTAAKIRLYSQVMTPVGAFFMYPGPLDASLEISPAEVIKMRIPLTIHERRPYRPHRHEREARKAEVR